jgi:hypothetical protein
MYDVAKKRSDFIFNGHYFSVQTLTLINYGRYLIRGRVAAILDKPACSYETVPQTTVLVATGREGEGEYYVSMLYLGRVDESLPSTTSRVVISNTRILLNHIKY